ncbi:MAG TPA: hypothetical protein VF543_22550 [Pyrinomonadaceae bacterium]|jgi:bifunctional DNA-binding transcriptional regulator/antitoxin component of YhaV-PrlF toxin-antitoxin module
MKKLTTSKREILKRLAAGDLLYVLPEKAGRRHALLHKRDHNSTNLRRVKFETLASLEADGWIEPKKMAPDVVHRFEFVLTEKGRVWTGISKGRVVARSLFVPDYSGDELGRARVPGDVRAALRAKVGDQLIFEEGCMSAVENALKRKGDRKYFVVYLEPAPPSVEQPSKAPVAEAGESLTPQIETLEESVRRKLGGQAT